MYFLIKGDDLWKKWNAIWDKVNADIRKNLIACLSTIKEFLKTKIKSHADEVTDFYDKKNSKMDFNYPCLAVISLDSALKKMKTIIHKFF